MAHHSAMHPASESHSAIHEYLLESPCRSIFYIPQFITAEEASSLITHIFQRSNRWTTLRNRRLQTWGTMPAPPLMNQSWSASKHQPLPSWMHPVLDRIQSLGIFSSSQPPNNCLVNEYRPGQGIMPHLDGPKYTSMVATVSLGEAAMLDFYPYHSNTRDEYATDRDKIESSASYQSDIKPAFSVIVEPLSLLVLQDEAYDHYMHGIDESFEFSIGGVGLTDEPKNTTVHSIINADTVRSRILSQNHNAKYPQLSVTVKTSTNLDPVTKSPIDTDLDHGIVIHRVCTRVSLTFRHAL
ncbi:hypothetical protein BDV3_005057 [Batrachochytrium dendrobatidis]|nr:hypothetical protein QVD99_002518 [Batrachochytrium dendrobatidis]